MCSTTRDWRTRASHIVEAQQRLRSTTLTRPSTRREWRLSTACSPFSMPPALLARPSISPRTCSTRWPHPAMARRFSRVPPRRASCSAAVPQANHGWTRRERRRRERRSRSGRQGLLLLPGVHLSLRDERPGLRGTRARRGPGASQEIANAAGRRVALAAQLGEVGGRVEMCVSSPKRVRRHAARAADSALLLSRGPAAGARHGAAPPVAQERH
jgi:hypothetical protein